MPSRRPTPQDATQLLIAEHREVEALFEQVERLAARHDDDQKMLVAAQICAALEIHMRIEEEILYPAARQAFGPKHQGLVDEAVVEHEGVRGLVDQLKTMASDEPLYDAKLKVLGEYVAHHVGEEERDFFPRLRRAAIDLVDLGRRLAARRHDLATAVAAEASA
jgi:hypothetical protein